MRFQVLASLLLSLVATDALADVGMDELSGSANLTLNKRTISGYRGYTDLTGSAQYSRRFGEGWTQGSVNYSMSWFDDVGGIANVLLVGPKFNFGADKFNKSFFVAAYIGGSFFVGSNGTNYFANKLAVGKRIPLTETILWTPNLNAIYWPRYNEVSYSAEIFSVSLLF
jgi:hypothetical protein